MKSGKRDIWVIDANGTNAKNLTNGSGSFTEPRFSPQKKKGE
jgi:Tol biopolymer transport system component